MDFVATLTQRNAEFAASAFSPDLKILPSMRTVIVGCVDPRVDPAVIFALQPGEAVVIRNVAGRVDMATLKTMAILRRIAQGAGQDMGEGWTLVVLHHTDCGIKAGYRLAPELLANQLGVAQAELDGLAINDPDQAVAIDIAAIRRNPQFSGAITVTGIVYDVATGRIAIVVPPGRLRPEADR